MRYNSGMKYIKRIVDDILDKKAQTFGAVNIVGPKGCGKTRTAKERCATYIEFQDEDKRDGYLSVAGTAPSLLLRDKKPILFDEWQDAPKIWGAIRKACDDNPGETGSYYLTGSTSQRVDLPHSGTGRISEVQMYTMTVYETGESNGLVSLAELFNNPDYVIEGQSSNLELEELFYLSTRGGWPRCLSLQSDNARLQVARDYYHQIYTRDINTIDGSKKNPEIARTVLWSYARNIATPVKKTKLLADVRANTNISESTFDSYVEALEKLYVIKDIDAWTPQIRSKTAIRATKKRVFIDPSIAIAALGLSQDYFYKDLDLFGRVFENMVIRDLVVYAESMDGNVKHYRDEYGMEADAVFSLSDGRYALIEIKVGAGAIRDAEDGLLRFLATIRKHNEEALKNPEHPKPVYREPDLLIVICANLKMAYTTENGVKAIPYGCLKN